MKMKYSINMILSTKYIYEYKEHINCYISHTVQYMYYNFPVRKSQRGMVVIHGQMQINSNKALTCPYWGPKKCTMLDNQ